MVSVDSSLAPADGASIFSGEKSLVRGWLTNEWISAGLIFGLTRLVALIGAYSGTSQLILAEPARNKGWVAELGLMWDSAHYAIIAQQHYTYDPASPGGSNVAF